MNEYKLNQEQYDKLCELIEMIPASDEQTNASHYLITTIKKISTPTADEVCEALKNYWGNPVVYDKEDRLFKMYLGDSIWTPVNLLRLKNAPQFLVMIGKFYMNEVGE